LVLAQLQQQLADDNGFSLLVQLMASSKVSFLMCTQTNLLGIYADGDLNYTHLRIARYTHGVQKPLTLNNREGGSFLVHD